MDRDGVARRARFRAGLPGTRAWRHAGRLPRAAPFLAALLDWHLNRYFRSVETLEERIDAIEETMLKADLDEEVLPLLTRLRAKVSQLRSVLAPQREVFADRGLLFVHRKGWL